MVRTLLIASVALSLTVGIAAAQTREEKVRNDKQKVEAEGFWIYNDLARGLAEAKTSGKPLVVVLRCIPCEQCVKLDEDLVDQNERLQALLAKFVRVRLISANGLDLSMFQFDTDQSFAVFLLNADGTIYGRFGTRSDQSHWTDDVSIEGLARALEGALELHREYPKNKAALAAKKGPPPEFAAPEEYPTLKEKYGSELNYEGNVVQSCIHCHQIGDAQRRHHREQSRTLPDEILFPYVHPKAIGLILDPHKRASVLRVADDSPAAAAGFRAGDEIAALNGQPLLSIADVQWVLHHTSPQGGKVVALVRRGRQTVTVELMLSAGWRQRDDIAWRASSWELRRMGLGGMFLKPLSDELRGELKLPESGMALRVQHVGQYAPHDRARRAGFQAGDVLTSFDGRTDLARETDLLVYALNQMKPGAAVPIELLRGGKPMKLTLPAN